MSYLPVSNFNSPSSPTLRRSGAIRKLLPPPRRPTPSESESKHMVVNIECLQMAGSTERKLIQRRATEGDLPSRDWHRGYSNGARFLNTLIAALAELQAEQAGKTISEPSNAPVCETATAEEIDWRDTLIWDLNGVLHLRRLLALWAECKVPASDIGLFLVKVLYERDEHLGNRLTQLVNLNESFTNIALGIMKHYQVRDSDDQPLWTVLNLGEVELRPSSTSSLGPSSSTSIPTLTARSPEPTTTHESHRTAKPSPVDLPPRWPFYMSGADLEDFFLNNGPESSADGAVGVNRSI